MSLGKQEHFNSDQSFINENIQHNNGHVCHLIWKTEWLTQSTTTACPVDNGKWNSIYGLRMDERLDRPEQCKRHPNAIHWHNSTTIRPWTLNYWPDPHRNLRSVAPCDQDSDHTRVADAWGTVPVWMLQPFLAHSTSVPSLVDMCGPGELHLCAAHICMASDLGFREKLETLFARGGSSVVLRLVSTSSGARSTTCMTEIHYSLAVTVGLQTHVTDAREISRVIWHSYFGEHLRSVTD